ncbi:MAG TPA: hypothetical protein PKL29_04010 [Methanothrix sp.]|nr:hypothetical protein [Methanothrix sp.]HPS91016.1 hypothetical protein [Methanothrix sp.]
MEGDSTYGQSDRDRLTTGWKAAARGSRLPGIRTFPVPRTVIIAELRTLKADFDRFKKVHKEFTARTTNEIDELFAKFEQEPTEMQADQAKVLI